MSNKPKYGIVLTSMFKKDIKLAKKRGYDLSLLTDVIDTGCRECHITPDWLLIYEIDDGKLFLYLTRTGTHSDLF